MERLKQTALALSLGVLLCAPAIAQPEDAATNREDFCAFSRKPGYHQDLLRSWRNQLSFHNQGGLFNGGVCWWHSRLTRAAAYLALYRPGQAKPDSAGARRIIDALIAGNAVVEIPGYENLYEFSRDHKDLVISALEAWQIREGSIGSGWLIGLQGSVSVDPKLLRRMMDQLHERVSVRREVIYQMMQVPGIPAHAWLVIGSTRTGYGYRLEVVDSNAPGQVLTISYWDGDRSLSSYFGDFVPYTMRSAELRRYEQVIRRYCGSN